jgi:hypothetical protein
MADKSSSRVFSPERYSFNSSDDNTTPQDPALPLGFYSAYTVKPVIPILKAKSVELLRASIPCITPSIPDSETTFWYYRLPKQVGYDEPVPPSAEYLHSIRLQPSFVPIDLVDSVDASYPINRSYNNYTDLLSDLNLACTNDLNNPFFIASDVSFSLSADNRFVFTGKNIYDLSGNLQYFYLPAGFKDVNVEAAKRVLHNATVNNFGIQGLLGQPYFRNRDLNLRLGFTYSGEILSQNVYRNHVRPVPNYYLGGEVLFDTPSYTAETYADLVYSGNLQVYCNLVSGSAYDSSGRPDLLSIVPLNTASLGVAFYSNNISAPLTKIPDEIYEVRFLLRSDTGDFYVLPDSAICNIELKFTY